MIYLLDTDVLILLVRGLKSTRRPEQRQKARGLLKRCQRAQAAGNSVGLSAITVSELEYGARHSDGYDAEMIAVHKVFAPFDVYDYDAIICPPHYGRIRQELEGEGMTIGAMDLLVAAHALALNATLISNNQAHFSRVTDLRTENWLPQAG
jgi:tRNA(fMet)-specific endonuclease VapC